MALGHMLVWGLIYGIPSILLAFSIHEFMHACAARLLGDPTPEEQGRMTLNPVPHYDRFGTPLVLVTYLCSLCVNTIGCFGWGKPLPINPYNFKDPRSGTLIVSLAGPVSNLIAAILAALVLKFARMPVLRDFMVYFIQISIWLGLFNLIPLPPLDGWKILSNGLAPRIGYRMQALESRFAAAGMTIVLVLYVTGILNSVAAFFFRILTGGS
jgi:Zn-dependent protease